MSHTAPPDDDDRGASPVAVTRRKKWLSKQMLTAALGVVVCGVGGLCFWNWYSPSEPPIKERLPQQMGVVVPYAAPMLVPTPVATAQPPVVKPEPVQPPRDGLVIPHQEPMVRATQSAAVMPPPEPKPNMVSYADPPTPPGGSGATTTGPGGAAAKSGVTYAATHLEGVQAGLLGDQTFLLTPGMLPCIMDTAINSTFEGPIQCHIPFDVRPHGVTLLGRGSIVHGTYKNTIQEGQTRIQVASDWVEDPATGCFIGLDQSPVSDPIGQAGIAGSVDNHYPERFLAAVLLDLGQSGIGLAQAMLSKGGNTYLSFSSGGGVQDVASMILQKQINIPPTITINQGTPIAVFVNKVLDFSACYSLKLRDNR